MKNSLMSFLSVAGLVLAAGSLAMSAHAQSNVVYAAEYNQSTNQFGTINLLSGNFTKISSIGAALINDIAYCPTNGMVYGISNSLALVTFNETNGTMTKVTNLSVSGIQSLAFRPSDGALFGASQSALYTVNPTTGKATSVGNYGSPTNLNSKGQNIRFAQDGNLYVSNTSTNTDVYRLNTTNGAATWMGEAVGYPYLMLQNASSNMYSVFINLGSVTNQPPELVTFDLSSFVVGGTNANGSTHQITVKLVGAGTNFPANFNFSGNVPQAITNLTVPVSATGPSNQTTVVGSNVVFSTVASGTGPYSYAWLKNGSTISGQTNSSLTLNNVTTTNAATYSVIVGGAIGTVTNSATLTVNKASATVTLGSLSQTYNGTAEPATATTTPSGLAVTFTYNGSATVPTNAGSYTVVGTINDANYQGSATGTLVIAQASASVTLSSLNQTYSGSAEPATATTTPSGLAVTFTYNGSTAAPTNAGSYTVVGTINDPNYQGSTTGTLVIAQASGSITLGSLSQTYNGSAKLATATTTPSGLAVTFTYNGSAAAPTNAGSYTVVGTINNANYQGSATGTLVINKASSSITLGSLNQTYNGTAEAATATTTPGGLTVTFTYNGSATVPTAAGTYTVVGTINDPNYQGSATGALVINALPVNLTGTRSYDGTTTAAAGIMSVANKVGSDNVIVVSGSGTLAGANVGSEAITSLGTLALGGTAAGNYTLAGASGSVNISVSALALTVTNLLALDKVYDGTTNATLDATNAGLAGVLNGDDVTLVASNAVAYFADKNVSTNKPVTVTDLVLGGAAAANYTLLDPTNVTADVSVAELTVAGVTAASKVYDGTTNVQLNGTATLNGAVSGDDVSLVTDGASAAFAGQNVGTGIPVTVSGYAITGADAGNYTLTQPSGLAADITAATLTITAASNTKIYDGTTSATATPTVSGLQGNDSVTGLAETYDTQNAGTGKTLSVSAYTVNDGNSGNNYTISAVTSTAGVINAATLTITAAANTKTYDGSASAAAIPTVSGLQGSDSVTGLAETYDTKNAGTGKTISVSAYTVNDGNSGNNYTVSTVASTAGVISPATLTITASDANKVYGTTLTFAGTEFTPTGTIYAGDSVTNVTLTSFGADQYANAGSHRIIPSNAQGTGVGNYTITYVNGTLTVTPAPLTITASSTSKTYGATLTFAGTEFMTSGLLNHDGVTGVTLTSDGAVNTAIVGGYNIVPGAATGRGLGNYTITYGNGTLTVNPAVLSVTANDASRVYGTTNPVFTASYSGFVNGEDASVLSGAPDLACSVATNSPVSVYSNAIVVADVGSLSATNYTFSQEEFTNGTLTVAVAALTPQITASDKVYDGTTAATLTSQTLSGVVGSDDVSLVMGAANFGDKNVGNGKTVTASGLSLSGTQATNYILAATTATTTASITPASLTVSATGQNKMYDGTTAATVTLSDNHIGNDDVSETYTSAVLDSQNTGTWNVTVSGVAISGTDAGNYTCNTTASTTASITPLAITVSAVTDTKTYDGTTRSVGVPSISPALVGSDTPAFTQSFDTPNAGTGKTLTPAGAVNDGNGGNNYAVSIVASKAGMINAATLTIAAAANIKTYDGSASAAAIPTVSGLQGNNTVTGLAETYDTKNTGTGKTISVSAYVVNDGNSGNNYTVSTVASKAGVINAATLTIAAAANTKTYDGSTSASATPMVSGLQGFDSVSGLAETYDTKNAGTGKTLSVSTYTVNDGNSGNNYTVSTVTSTAGVINPAALTVTADNKSKICGRPNPPLTASYNGFAGGESASVLSSPAVLSTTATTTSGAGKYPITVSGAADANYTIQYVNGTLQVVSAPQLAVASINVNGVKQFVVSWPTMAGQTYQLEYTTNLTAPQWTALGTPFAGTDGIVAVTNSMSVTPQCFFRVGVQ